MKNKTRKVKKDVHIFFLSVPEINCKMLISRGSEIFKFTLPTLPKKRK